MRSAAAAGALDRRLAEFLRHAAEGALIDLAFFRTAERHAEMLELVDGLRRVAAQIFDRVLIAQPVRPLDGVVHVPAPIVGLHIAERGRNAALRRDRMAARRKHLGDVGDLQPVPRRFERRAQACAARAHDDDVECVIGDRIGSHRQEPVDRDAQNGDRAHRADRERGEFVEKKQRQLQALAPDIILDDRPGRRATM